MFTGLVEGVGRVQRLETRASEIRLTITVPPPLLDGDGCRLGESVAINGCCLSAIAIDGANWTFQAGQETLAKTTLGELREGSRINLERALPAAGRFGGHFVQGHIDGVGRISAVEQENDWSTMTIVAPSHLAKQIVPKGSIAVDGVSLTVVDVVESTFSIALIPHTLVETTLGERRAGDRANLETDIIGKYVSRQLASQRADLDQDSPRIDTETHGIA